MGRVDLIMGYHLVLASQSPRRKELLAQAGIPFTAQSPQIEEKILPEESAADYVQRLATEKSLVISPQPGQLVLAADTIVVLPQAGGELILEKPNGPAEAKRMLELLSGTKHEVLTGLCLRSPQQCWTALERTSVFFAELQSADIDAYIDSGEPFDKAGAYGIQGLAAKFIPRIEGCYFNVVGLPLNKVRTMLSVALAGGSLSAVSSATQ